MGAICQSKIKKHGTEVKVVLDNANLPLTGQRSGSL